LGGPIVTASGLVFIGATDDRRFRALNAKNGQEMWAAQLAYSAQAVPITYRGKDGREYVAVTAAIPWHAAGAFRRISSPSSINALIRNPSAK